MTSTHRVFVYGTLKQGQPNHHVITQSKGGHFTFIGQGRTAEKYPLVIASNYNIPFLLKIEGEGHNVVGEVYDVNDALFADLDILEGYPGFYDRQKVSIKMEKMADGAQSSDVVECWIYLLPEFKPYMKDLTKYENYDSYGSHGKLYVTRSERDAEWTYTLTPSVHD